MGAGLGPRQKQVILFLDSQPNKRSIRREIYDHFIRLGVINESETEKIRRVIKRLMDNQKAIKKPRTRDLTRTDLYLKHPSQCPDLLELQYTEKVKKFLEEYYS